jgi:signal transduction histidine kinase
MKHARTGLSARYLAALRTHLLRKNRDNGDRAQGLGRAAAAQGLVARDLAVMHELAVVTLAASPDFAGNTRDSLRRTGYFFTQALMPLEAVQRTTRKANRNLEQRNETLRLHTAALARGNRQLAQQVRQRQAGVAALQRGKVRYQKLFGESQVMQRKLRLLTRQILSAQEEERKRISRELHDEVVQTLVGINVQLSALGHGAATGLHTLKAKIVRTQRLVEKSVKAVHRFARDLRPAVLDDLGLIPALQAFSEALATRGKIKIRIVAFGGVEALSAPKRTVLFRVAQEALTNVIRHAQASEVKLTLSQIPGNIRMEIADNGKSFRVEHALATGGRKRLGLVGMKERMEMTGGRLAIESIAGTGTTVRADIPFAPSPKKS